MKRFSIVFLAIGLFFSPTAYAAVVFNEIAWMGSLTSSTDEWIELHNTAMSPVDMVGWKITGKGNAEIVALSGTIAPNAYFLIERSDDDTVPNVHADLITSFGKGISNDGETLKLIDGTGVVIDTIVGGKKWSKLGGDNTSKMTAQRTASGWITAPATPQALNRVPTKGEVATPITQAPPQSKRSIASAKTSNSIPVATPLTEKNNSSVSIAHKKSLTPSSTIAANVLWQRPQDQNAAKHAWVWMISSVLLVIFASVIVMRANVEEPNEADKYAIIEDIIERVHEDD